MYWFNKAVWALVNPMTIGLVLLLMSILIGKRFPRIRMGCLCGLGLLFYSLSTGWFFRLVGAPLEWGYPQVVIENCPQADAIVCLGGGVFKRTNNITAYPELESGADRVYLSALLWKAGKAPCIITSNHNVTNSDDVVLRDLGVRPDAILSECEATTTEGNARFVQRLLDKQVKLKMEVEQRKVSVLLVTSAWHMRRSLYMFEKYAPEIQCIPAACDYEVMTRGALSFRDFIPSPDAFAMSSMFLHEWLGILGYHFRR